MADEYDYTRMWSGVFTPPHIGDDGGIYLLDDERTVGRNTEIYDSCTRVLYDDAHPRTYPGGQRYPGPYGAGRASDRIGPTLEERRQAERRRTARFAGEGFDSRPNSAYGGPDLEERDLYIEGSRRLGHPGPRGMVTSSRENRPAIDDIVWDNRPPHYAADTPNEYAHLYIDPEARGPPLFQKDPTYPGFRQVDRFGKSKLSLRDGLDIIKVVLLVIIVVLAAMWLMTNRMIAGAEKRMQRELECSLREIISAAARPV